MRLRHFEIGDIVEIANHFVFESIDPVRFDCISVTQSGKIAIDIEPQLIKSIAAIPLLHQSVGQALIVADGGCILKHR